MKQLLQLILTPIALMASFLIIEGADKQSDKLLTQQKSQATFEENKGQVRDQNWNARPDVLFYGQSGDMVYHIRKDGISYNLNKLEENPFEKEGIINHLLAKETSEELKFENYRVDLDWKGSNSQFKVEKGCELFGYNNYYNVPNGMAPALFVKTYQNITLKNIWDGVDLHYYGKNGVLESDWIMEKAEDYKKIRFEIFGADITVTSNGTLVLKTPFGEIREGALKVYQNNEVLTARWVVKNNEVSFEIEDFNPMLSMVIDPPTLAFATYYGGSGLERGLAVTSDSSDNIYFGGETASNSNVATTGSHQTSFGSGGLDAFMVKFNSNGVRQWATYYGGSGSDYFYQFDIDKNGYVYTIGSTGSSSNISTPSSYQSSLSGSNDAFIVKFDGNGLRQWATYVGGASSDYGFSIAVSNDVLYIGGSTNSSNGISTNGTAQTSYGGSQDGFIAKFDLNGFRQWGTYVGGTSTDGIWRITVDEFDNLYVSGQTKSSSGIATSGGFQPAYGGGDWNGFLVKYNSMGQKDWGTYYGSSSAGYGCAVYENTVYLSGSTTSSTGISHNGFQNTIGGSNDAILVAFNLSGGRKWATYIGGSGAENAFNCKTDSRGNISIIGYTTSTNGIASPNAFKSTNGGGEDGFFVLLDSLGNRIYGTYFGGSGNERLINSTVTSNDDFLIAGKSTSSINVASSNAHQTSLGGNRDAVLIKFNAPCPSNAFIITQQPSNITAAVDSNAVFVVNASASNIQYRWQMNSGLGFTNLENAGQYSGVFTNTLTVSNITMANNSSLFRCILTSGQCDSTTQTAMLTADNSALVQYLTNTNAFLKVYPNPFQNDIIAEINKEQVGNTYQVIDLHGKVVLSGQFTEEKMKVSLSEMAAGYYVFRIIETAAHVKVVKY